MSSPKRLCDRLLHYVFVDSVQIFTFFLPPQTYSLFSFVLSFFLFYCLLPSFFPHLNFSLIPLNIFIYLFIWKKIVFRLQLYIFMLLVDTHCSHLSFLLGYFTLYSPHGPLPSLLTSTAFQNFLLTHFALLIPSSHFFLFFPSYLPPRPILPPPFPSCQPSPSWSSVSQLY